MKFAFNVSVPWTMRLSIRAGSDSYSFSLRGRNALPNPRPDPMSTPVMSQYPEALIRGYGLTRVNTGPVRARTFEDRLLSGSPATFHIT